LPRRAHRTKELLCANSKETQRRDGEEACSRLHEARDRSRIAGGAAAGAGVLAGRARALDHVAHDRAYLVRRCVAHALTEVTRRSVHGVDARDREDALEVRDAFALLADRNDQELLVDPRARLECGDVDVVLVGAAAGGAAMSLGVVARGAGDPLRLLR